MSLRNVLLVYLASGASTGYDIARGFRGSFGYLWNASYQQVYRDLASLHAEGLVSCQAQASSNGRPAKKLYRLTEAGQQAMQDWFATPARLPRYNDAFMVKVASAHLMPDKRPLLDELRANRERYQRYLDGLLRYRQMFDAMPQAADMLRYARLSLERGINVNQSWLAWADQLEQTLLAEIHAAPVSGTA